MNILAFIIGIFISIAVIVHFKRTRLENSKFAYSALLFTFPFYYFAFSIYGNDYAALPLELIGGLAFFIIAISALKFSNFYKFLLLAIGYIFHGIYDVIHHLLFINNGTPNWWPEFCGSIDIILGLYLVTLAFKFRVKNA
jgi:uncharacterized membrane protein HdeD (DUF308 family)